MSPNRDVLELWRRLRQESLFVSSERESLGKLHNDLKEDHYKLLQQLYRTRRLQSNHYVAETGGDLGECFSIDNRLQIAKFTEMPYQEAEMIAPFLKSLKDNPTLVAACLVYGEKMQLESATGFNSLLETVVLSLYGQSCATQNHSALLEFIQCLMLHQIGATNRPRDVLKRGAFITTYRLLVEALPESRLFLTAALYQPIVQVLLDEGPPLEIDADKVCDYFSPRELQLRFGQRGSDPFKQKVAEFCKNTQQRLDDHVKRFSHAIEQSLACFPSAIAYIIARSYNIVSDGGMCPPDEARTLAADLLLQDFICLAIVNPERYGVTGDLPITETSRINLIQIAQKLQRAVISGGVRHSGGFLTRMVEEILTLDSGEPNMRSNVTFEDRTVLCTRKELERLIIFMRQVEISEVQGVDRGSLNQINQLVKKFKMLTPPPQSPLGSPIVSKSPPPKFAEKAMNFIDKMDNKVKQFQQEGIKGLDKLRIDEEVEKKQEEVSVFIIPLPGTDEEFKILSEQDIVTQSELDDDRASIDDDGVSRGSKSNYSVEDDRTSSSSVSDHLSSLHGSAGAPVEVDRLQDETDSIAESNPHSNRDATLQALDEKMPTNRESIEDRMRKFELGVRFDIGNDRGDTRSDCWSTDVAASEHSEPLTEADYASRLEEIAEDPSEELRVPPEDSRSDIWSVECLVPSDNEDEEGPHSPPAEEMRSRASTPGLSYTAESVSSAFSESGQKPEAAGDYASSQETNDNRSDDGRGQNRSPRPSVLQNTEAWRAQQAALSQTTVERISPTENQPDESKPAKIGNRRSFGIKNFRKGNNVMKPKPSIPQKLLPSALRKNSNSAPLTPPALATTSTSATPGDGNSYSAFDVMAKYQQMNKKEEPPTGNLIDIEPPKTPTPPIEKRLEKTKKESIDEKQARLEDVRRKLRYVLSAADPVDASPMMPSTRTTSQHEKLLELLRAQAYEALAIQDRNTAAQLQETLRAVEQLSQTQTKQVLDFLWKEYNRRSDYVRYLVRARQKLLGALAHIRRMSRAGERAQESGRRHFLSVAASILLKKKSDSITAFVGHYNRQQTMDDKATLVNKLLQFLFGQIQQEPEWKHTNHNELEEIQAAVHRSLLTRHNIYHLIIYPNREVDIERDRVFTHHIEQISAKIRTDHPKLQIPQKYCRECPWPSAQEEARLISVYRTPGEKMLQTTRLCKAILNLLKLSNPSNIPGADDLVPVLVYVIIKANPPALLSMIQYVEAYEPAGAGEDSFYWMQFTAACKFIQTIEP